jgi:hypothetical protein
MGSINGIVKDIFINLFESLPLLPKKINRLKLEVMSSYNKYGDIVHDGISHKKNAICPYIGACGQFVPMFDVSLKDSDDLIYHTYYNSKNFIKNKPIEAKLSNNDYLIKDNLIPDINSDIYIYNLNIETNKIEFLINENLANKNYITNKNTFDFAKIYLLKFHNDSTSTTDPIIIKTYDVTSSNVSLNIDDIELTDEILINIQLFYKYNKNDIINNLNYLENKFYRYNNYENYFKVINQLNITDNILKCITYEFIDSTETNNNSPYIIKYNSNHVLAHPHTKNIYIESLYYDFLDITIRVASIKNDSIVDE